MAPFFQSNPREMFRCTFLLVALGLLFGISANRGNIIIEKIKASCFVHSDTFVPYSHPTRTSPIEIRRQSTPGSIGPPKCRQQTHSTSTWLDCRGGGVADEVARKSQSSLSMTSPGLMNSNSHFSPNDNSSTESYHLIWSTNFWKKFVLSAVLWTMISSLTTKLNLSTVPPPLTGSHLSCPHDGGFIITSLRTTLARTIILPLLSGSCCAIQLLLNTISGWGCAGFNTHLGPVRPLLLAIFLTSTYIRHRSPLMTFMSLILAFLPEIVHIFNIRSARLPASVAARLSEDTTASRELTSQLVEAKLYLDVPSMGCVACVNKIDAAIRSCSSFANIREARSWLKEDKGGIAELAIVAERKGDVDRIARDVVDAVKVAGFHCKIESIHITD